LRRRKISPVELTQMMLDRIHTLDVRLHSYATVMADEALASARPPSVKFSPETTGGRCTASHRGQGPLLHEGGANEGRLEGSG
jgi:hypothetical protein